MTSTTDTNTVFVITGTSTVTMYTSTSISTYVISQLPRVRASKKSSKNKADNAHRICPASQTLKRDASPEPTPAPLVGRAVPNAVSSFFSGLKTQEQSLLKTDRSCIETPLPCHKLTQKLTSTSTSTQTPSATLSVAGVVTEVVIATTTVPGIA